MYGKICKSTDRTYKNKLAKSLPETREIISAPLEHVRKHESVALTKIWKTPARLNMAVDYLSQNNFTVWSY